MSNSFKLSNTFPEGAKKILEGFSIRLFWPAATTDSF